MFDPLYKKNDHMPLDLYKFKKFRSKGSAALASHTADISAVAIGEDAWKVFESCTMFLEDYKGLRESMLQLLQTNHLTLVAISNTTVMAEHMHNTAYKGYKMVPSMYTTFSINCDDILHIGQSKPTKRYHRIAIEDGGLRLLAVSRRNDISRSSDCKNPMSPMTLEATQFYYDRGYIASADMVNIAKSIISYFAYVLLLSHLENCDLSQFKTLDLDIYRDIRHMQMVAEDYVCSDIAYLRGISHDSDAVFKDWVNDNYPKLSSNLAILDRIIGIVKDFLPVYFTKVGPKEWREILTDQKIYDEALDKMLPVCLKELI